MSNEFVYKLLAVDDEPIVHSMVNIIVGESSLPITVCATALSGVDALARAAECHPDICLLDINMDGMDGLELARRLTEQLGYTPRIIYLSAHDNFQYAQQAIRVGASEYLLKPIRSAELVAALGKAVNALQQERIARLERERLEERIGPAMPDVTPPSETRNAAIAKEARKYIEDHFAEPISLSSVSKHLRLSSGYLGSLFKSVTGLSFRSFLRGVRISRAKELMLDPRLNLSEVAEAVGYPDLNYFSQAFLAETGVRPGEYRGSGRRWAK